MAAILYTGIFCFGAEDSFVVDTLVFRTYFGLSDYSSINDKDFNAAVSKINEFKGREETIVSIEVYGKTSIEGPEPSNNRLSTLRADYVADRLVQASGIDRSMIRTVAVGEDWDLFRETIEESESQYRDAILEVLSSNKSRDEKESALKLLDGGAVWEYLLSDVFPSLRSSLVIIVFQKDEDEQEEKPVETPEPVMEPVTEPEPELEISHEPVIESVQIQQNPRYMSVKTNCLLVGSAVANVGFEIGFADHFSFALPVAYSPYTIASNWRLRLLGIQPELRYWFKQNREGLFVGLHSHVAYYNISTVCNKPVRYQDRDGRHPLFGGGLNVGYGFVFGKEKNWGVELTAGAGYAYLDYEKFHNTDNGALFDSGTKNYWGPTKAAINISYRFKQWDKKRMK